MSATSAVTGVAWPPPAAASSVPEPLRSYLHAYALGRLDSHVAAPGLQPGELYRDEPAWRALYRYQVTLAAHGDEHLLGAITEHVTSLALDLHGAWPHLADLQPGPELATNVVARLIWTTGMRRPEPDPVPLEHPRRTREWLRRWALSHPVQAVPECPSPATSQLWHLRLGMAEESAVAEVIAAAGGGALGPVERFPSGGAAPHTGLRVDETRLRRAFPELETHSLVRWTDRAIMKRHLFGLLGRAEMKGLGLTPADRPCGIDVSSSETPDHLALCAWALTGTSTRATLVREWARHEHLDWGEDQEVLFRRDDRDALSSALSDPWCVKREEVEEYLDRLA